MIYIQGKKVLGVYKGTTEIEKITTRNLTDSPIISETPYTVYQKSDLPIITPTETIYNGVVVLFKKTDEDDNSAVIDNISYNMSHGYRRINVRYVKNSGKIKLYINNVKFQNTAWSPNSYNLNASNNNKNITGLALNSASYSDHILTDTDTDTRLMNDLIEFTPTADDWMVYIEILN